VRAQSFIGAEKAAGHGVARACRLLRVSRAAYYQRCAGGPSPRAAADAAITARITSIHAESRGTYGSPRVHQALRRQDVSCGRRRVARLMRASGLEGRRKKRWRTTTIADPAAERARDLIQRDFAPRPGTDQRYAGDITYVMTWEGWAYLATVTDLSSRRVVGWALADHMRTSLVEDALSMAFTTRRPADGVIFHGDRPWPTRAGLHRVVFDYIEGLVQHPPAPQFPRLSQPRRIRANPAQRQPTGGMINSRNLSAKADQAQGGRRQQCGLRPARRSPPKST
jgi:putative transposase